MTADEAELRVAWHAHVGTGGTADEWFDSVLAAYRAPDRHYHGVRHVRWVVHHGRELAAVADPPLRNEQVDEVVAAAFFHDLVYDARRPDNEEVSARRSRQALGEIGWPPAATERVVAMIEATAGHDVADFGDDPAIAVLVAADLGVLAAEPSRYDNYTRAVRREYAHLDDREWRAGRSAFISDMLAREHILPPRLGLDGWERRARANLTAELAALA